MSPAGATFQAQDDQSQQSEQKKADKDKNNNDDAAKSQDQETTDSAKRPPSGEDREPRDESGLPASAFNPMQLYNEADDEVSPVLPTVEPGAEGGIIKWPYVTVHVKERYIDIEGVVGIDEGFLEQVACTPSTRGHESLVIAFARPSHIHAALLLLGLEPGKPGEWIEVPPTEEGGQYTYRVIPPEGAKVTATVLYKRNEGDDGDDDKKNEERVEVPIRDWIVDYRTGKPFPEGPWIFGGSLIKRDFMDRERYVADLTGSIMGLVTFGDETIGWNEVLPDQEAFWEPEWVCNTKIMPKWNTPVTLRIRPCPEKDEPENDAAGQVGNEPVSNTQEDGGESASDAENPDSHGK